MARSEGILAVVQMTPRLGEPEANLDMMEMALEQIPGAAHRLVVFPEMACPGYFFERNARFEAMAELIPESGQDSSSNGPCLSRLLALAQKYDVYLVAGLAERGQDGHGAGAAGDDIFNTAVLVGPQGLIAKYRKLHLWSEEKLIYTPGNLGLVLADLPFARVGLMICYDFWFPEEARILRLLGADVLTIPAALVWNDTPGHVRHIYHMVNYVGIATAHLNQVFVALASQVGRWDGHWLFGSSFLTGPVGWLLTEPADDEHPAVLHAEVDFHAGRALRGWGKLDHFDRDRRIDVYGALLGYKGGNEQV